MLLNIMKKLEPTASIAVRWNKLGSYVNKYAHDIH